MSLTSGEVQRIRFELGYNVLSANAEPYIGVTSLFDQIIQPYLTAGASTTSSTAVSASASPTPRTLSLANAVGFAAGDRVVVDVDSRQEAVTVQSVSGSNIIALLSLDHTGTYPVTVEGGESIVRAILRQIQAISGLGTASGGRFGAAVSGAGIKKVDEIEFFGGGDGGGYSSTVGGTLERQLRYWRSELAAALGVENLRDDGGAGSSVAI